MEVNSPTESFSRGVLHTSRTQAGAAGEAQDYSDGHVDQLACDVQGNEAQ